MRRLAHVSSGARSSTWHGWLSLVTCAEHLELLATRRLGKLGTGQQRKHAMSRNCWEAGSVKLPAAEWKKARDALVQAWNARQLESLKVAQEVHTRLVAIKSAEGSKVLVKGLYEILDGTQADQRLLERVSTLDLLWQIQSAVLKRDTASGKAILIAPKKKGFPEAAFTKWAGCSLGDFSISVNHKAKSLGWNVSENNHAVEHARQHPLGVAFFKVLAGVRWTRGSGGTISGNDEYCRDTVAEGGGANYVTARFGPLGQASDPLQRLLRRAKSGAKRGGVGAREKNHSARQF